MTEQATAEEAEVLEEVTGEESLSDAFNDTEDEPEAIVAEEEAEEEKGAEEVTAEAETEPEPVETPSTESAGLQAALVAERRKRQEAEEKLKGLEEPETVPDPIEDPTGYADFITAKSDKGLLQTRIDLSRDVMMDSKEDYLEKETVFMGLIGNVDDDGKLSITDQTLFTKFQAAKNPARFAYQHAVQHLDIAAKSDPNYRDNLKAELKAEILAEMGGKPTGLKATEVPNLTKATATKSNSEPVEKLQELEDMFGD